MLNAELNFKRLNESRYSAENIFQPEDYGWQGDFEGRAILAFAMHGKMGKTSAELSKAIAKLPEKTNGKGYFGKPFDGKTVNEQQLSGHSWYLRGLLSYYELSGDETVLLYARNTVNDLYLPAYSFYSNYPLVPRKVVGDVSGSFTEVKNGWELSSDVGCAFMCVDGLSHYYAVTKDAAVKTLIKRIICVFNQADLLALKFQTHTTLSCLRGILRLYTVDKDENLLELVKEKFAFYEQNGMTLTYENFNWFGRNDTWTEPCCVVDSFILATELYKITGASHYLTLARRIWFNGLQFCLRSNGGAGPNSCVNEKNPVLKVSFYEADFCCTMRYSEGLLEYFNNESLFSWNKNAEIKSDDKGRKFVDDKLLVKDGSVIKPIFSCAELTKEQAEQKNLKVLF